MEELELDPSDSGGDGYRRFLIHVFRICKKCGNVSHRSTERHFSRMRVQWKHFVEPHFFKPQPGLLKLAGVADEDKFVRRPKRGYPPFSLRRQAHLDDPPVGPALPPRRNPRT